MSRFVPKELISPDKTSNRFALFIGVSVVALLIIVMFSTMFITRGSAAGKAVCLPYCSKI